MARHHPENERMKRAYFVYLEDAKRMAGSSVDQVAAHLAAFEESTNFRAFKSFHIEQARQFKRRLRERVNAKTGKPLAVATINSRLKALRAFFIWLADQPGYRSKLSYLDADYFNDSNNDQRIAGAVREKRVATIEEVRHVILSAPTSSAIERRNQALIALALLTGARDSAIASLSLKHVDLARSSIFQDAREVHTNSRKTFSAWFFPVGDDIERIFADWVNYLRTAVRFGPEDPLFPVTEVALDANGLFASTGLSNTHWQGTGAIRKVFKTAFETAGLPYSHPHLIRDTLTLLGEKVCQTPEELKIWSQNLGHEKVLTTLTSYGNVAAHRQAEVLATMRIRAKVKPVGKPGDPDSQTIATVLAYLQRRAS